MCIFNKNSDIKMYQFSFVKRCKTHFISWVKYKLVATAVLIRCTVPGILVYIAISKEGKGKFIVSQRIVLTIFSFCYQRDST